MPVALGTCRPLDTLLVDTEAGPRRELPMNGKCSMRILLIGLARIWSVAFLVRRRRRRCKRSAMAAIYAIAIAAPAATQGVACIMTSWESLSPRGRHVPVIFLCRRGHHHLLLLPPIAGLPPRGLSEPKVVPTHSLFLAGSCPTP